MTRTAHTQASYSMLALAFEDVQKQQADQPSAATTALVSIRKS
jgi:hypothetical protein